MRIEEDRPTDEALDSAPSTGTGIAAHPDPTPGPPLAAIESVAMLPSASDDLLAARAIDGDVRAFAVLVRRHGPFLRAYAIRMLGSTAECDDVVQDTFVTAWSQLEQLRDTGAVRGWRVRIATRKALDRIRARREHAELAEQDLAARHGDEPQVRAEASERERALEAALAELPDDQRRTWVLRELGGYSYTEIATELQLPVSTVRGLLARTRRALVTRMEGWR